MLTVEVDFGLCMLAVGLEVVSLAGAAAEDDHIVRIPKDCMMTVGVAAIEHELRVGRTACPQGCSCLLLSLREWLTPFFHCPSSPDWRRLWQLVRTPIEGVALVYVAAVVRLGPLILPR